MRCSNCNKFVSYDDPEVEVQDSSVDSDASDGTKIIDGGVNVSTRLVLKCVECSTELKEATFELEMPFRHDCSKPVDEREEGAEFQIDVDDPEATDREETIDKNGRSISPRYRKHFYGVNVHVDVTCPFCNLKFDVDGNDEIQASSMDEL